jgi:predicted AlkP superfamily phosphohydrolase/phosphomutase
MLQAVDWTRTRAYALGIGSVYLNVKGREARGIVDPADLDRLSGEIAQALDGIVDPVSGDVAVRGGSTRRQVYGGAFAAESPDIVVRFNRGYRASWSTALGGVPEGHFEDNTKRWGGDHIVDPALVPGVLFANRPIRTAGAALVDLAPTILAALGVAPGARMEGSSLLS